MVHRRRERRQREIALGREVARLCRAALRDEPVAGYSDDPGLEGALERGGVLGLVARVLPPDAALGRCAREVHRKQEIAALAHEAVLAELLGALRREGIDPVLLKGLSVARFYQTPGDRALGDIDLLVSRESLALAVAVAQRLGFKTWASEDTPERAAVEMVGELGYLDFQSALWGLAHGETEVALGSTNSMPILEETSVRVLSGPGLVRYLAVHAAVHNFGRPVWLCDLYQVMRIERVAWGEVLGGGGRVDSVVAAGAGLDSSLLGAWSIAPTRGEDEGLIAWLVDATLRRWGRDASATWDDRKYRVLTRSIRSGNVPLAASVLAAALPEPIEAMNELGWPLRPQLSGASVVVCSARRAWVAGRDATHAAAHRTGTDGPRAARTLPRN